MAQFPTVRAGVANVPMPQANADWRSIVSGLFDNYAAGQQYGRERDIQQGTQALLGQAGPNPNWNSLAQQLLGLGNERGANIAANIAQNQENYAFRNQQAAVGNTQWQQQFDANERYRADSRIPAGYEAAPSGGGYQAVPGGPADPTVIAAANEAKRPPKPLPSAAINNLTETGATATTLDNIAGGFKPDFAGQPVMGDFWNYVGRTYGGDSQPQAEWWQQYQAQKNVLRNKLFGSALTATEKGEFEKADINPGMKPEVIQTNLNRQRAAAQAAARKIAAGYLRSGYPADAIEGALGIPLGDLGVLDPASTAANRNNYTPPQPSPGSAKNEDRMPSGQRPATYQAPASAGPAEGATATNPETGQRLMFQGGQWVPM